MPTDESKINLNQVVAFITTFVTALISTKSLYEITNQKEILVAVMLYVFIVIMFLKKIIITLLYPKKEKEYEGSRGRRYILNLFQFIKSLVIVTLVLILYDIFSIELNKSALYIFQYILVVIPIPIFFIFTFVIVLEYE